jgi:hypothetical protein
MNTSELLRAAEEIYERRLKPDLERTHRDYYVAIEPVSEQHFLGRTLSEASAEARAAFPERRTAVLRVGHAATVHMGAGIT